MSVFLIAVVMMLSVYYLQMPNTVAPVGGNDIEETRDERLEASRVQIKNYRLDLKNDLLAILGSSQATIEQKNEDLSVIRTMETIVEYELGLELEIIELGYNDALVHALDDSVSITVVSSEQTTAQVNELFTMAKSTFGNHYSVSVNFLLPL